MAPLLKVLAEHNLLESGEMAWVREHQAAHHTSIDTSLLELDLIDEDGLLRGLELCYGLTAANHYDVNHLDPLTGELIPLNVVNTFSMCPLRLSGDKLVTLVERPLPTECLETLNSLGLRIEQLIAPTHYIALARSQAYGTTIEGRTLDLETRLDRRRGAPEIQLVLDRVAATMTLSSAVAEVLNFAAFFMEFPCLLIAGQDGFRIITHLTDKQTGRETIPFPAMGCTMGAALLYGGYFIGPLVGSDDDHAFYQTLGRSLPQRALVAPIPTPGAPRIVFYADNGPRGFATRWIAELLLLVSRLGQQIRVFGGTPAHRHNKDSPKEPIHEESPEVEYSESTLTVAELIAVDRLRLAASQVGMTMDGFVDVLLREHFTRKTPDVNTVLLSEVKGLFEQLAMSIPTQLAQGIETAFRDMPPRIVAPTPSTPMMAAERPQEPVQKTHGDIKLVSKEAAPRKVASYRERRAKSKRVKL